MLNNKLKNTNNITFCICVLLIKVVQIEKSTFVYNMIKHFCFKYLLFVCTCVVFKWNSI